MCDRSHISVSDSRHRHWGEIERIEETPSLYIIKCNRTCENNEKYDQDEEKYSMFSYEFVEESFDSMHDLFIKNKLYSNYT